VDGCFLPSRGNPDAMAVGAGLLPERYTGAQPIGRGGMGEIFRATDTTLGRAVAIKVLSEGYAQDASVRERFTREALAVARLSGKPEHRHDLRRRRAPQTAVHRDGVPPGRVARAEDPGRGRAIAAPGARMARAGCKRARRSTPRGRRAPRCEAGEPPARSVRHVHVADFGIASAAGLGSLTQTGTVLGTASYLSPEQAQGERTTPASDLYSLGIVAFELLNRPAPVRGRQCRR